MGLFSKIKKAVDDFGIVDTAKSIKQAVDDSGIVDTAKSVAKDSVKSLVDSVVTISETATPAYPSINKTSNTKKDDDMKDGIKKLANVLVEVINTSAPANQSHLQVIDSKSTNDVTPVSKSDNVTTSDTSTSSSQSNAKTTTSKNTAVPSSKNTDNTTSSKTKADTPNKSSNNKPRQSVKPMKSYCSKGKCLYFANGFYFTCPKTEPCNKKKEHLHDIKMVENPRFMDYAYEIDLNEGLVDFEIKEATKDIWRSKLVKLYRAFAREFYPNLVKYPLLIEHAFKAGIGEDTVPVRQLLEKANNLVKGYSKEQEKSLLYLLMVVQTNVGFADSIFKVFFAGDPSVLSLCEYDFDYLLKQTLFFFWEDAKAITSELFNGTVDITNIFFDSDNKLKRVGYGGEEAGEYGDTIWNSVQKIIKENIEDKDTLEKLTTSIGNSVESARSCFDRYYRNSVIRNYLLRS